MCRQYDIHGGYAAEKQQKVFVEHSPPKHQQVAAGAVRKSQKVAVGAAGAIGAIAGTLLAGFVFISYLGSTLTLALVALVYVAMALLSFWLAGRLPRAALLASIISLAFAEARLGSIKRQIDIPLQRQRFIKLYSIT